MYWGPLNRDHLVYEPLLPFLCYQQTWWGCTIPSSSSWIKMFKNTGSSIEPWDIPVVTSGFCMDFVPLITSLWPHKFTYISVHLTMHLLSLYSISLPMMLQETASRAKTNKHLLLYSHPLTTIITLQKSIRSVRHKFRLTTLNHLPALAQFAPSSFPEIKVRLPRQ